MKRILILGDINSPHIQKWVTSLVDKGFFVGVFSLSVSKINWHQSLANFKLFDKSAFDPSAFYQSTFQKIAFLKVMPSLKKTVQSFKPDVVHAHYASSYGLIGALSGFHPFFISVWGSDVFDFPEEGLLQKQILKFNLRKADKIFSTSNVMATQTKKFTIKEIIIIPFGIDTQRFKPMATERIFPEGTTVIGMVKTMEEKYGVQYLIRAFKLVKEKYPQQLLKLLLVGGGTQRDYLEQLAQELNISNDVIFTGNVPYSEIVHYHNLLDIAVYPSTLDSESFGVAVLESCACGKPVIVSDVAGLKEVVRDGITGFIIQRKNIEAIAAAIVKLMFDRNLREVLGVNGRKHVEQNYELNFCVEKMINIYNSLIK